jgi:membrane protein EpsK
VPKNLIANALYFTLNVLIGLLLVPYFIDSLGVASYALIPLATSLTNYVGIVTQALNSSVFRYLTIDLQKLDYKKANITFNTSLFGTFGITLLTVPILVLVSYYSSSFFDIPINQRQDAFLLFLGVMGSILVRTWGGNFGVSLFAYNRLDLQNIINSLNIVLQVIFIITLFSLWSPKLCYIGYSYFIAAVVALLITIILSKKVNPHFKVNIWDFRISQLKELIGTGGWIIIDQLGSLLLLSIDIILVDKLYGTVAGGEYSLILMWNGVTRSFAGILAGVLTPVILTYYAQTKFEELVFLSKSAVKLMGLALALPIGLICGFSPLILSFWVGPDFSKLSPLMWILIGHLAFNMSVLPLESIYLSYNKLRIPAIVTIFSGIANILLAVALSSITGWGYYGVAVAVTFILTVRQSIFIPIYATKVLGLPNNPFKSIIIFFMIIYPRTHQ